MAPMAQELEKSVFRVIATDGSTSGAGFIIDDGIAVTCAHVVTSAGYGVGSNLTVRLEDRDIEAHVISEGWSGEDEDDVAFLALRDFHEEARLLLLSDTNGCDGHSFRSLGFAKLAGYEMRWASGTIRGSVLAPRKKPMLQLDCMHIAKGMSGAPILSTVTDRVVGMVSEFADDEILRITWATTVDTLVDLLPKLRATVSEANLRPGSEFLPAIVPLRYQNSDARQLAPPRRRPNPAFETFDRHAERALFKRLLSREIQLRALVVHSNGDRGWGKSELLRLFYSLAIDDTTRPTRPLFFDVVDTSITETSPLNIMDWTASAFGFENFPGYWRMSARLRASADPFDRDSGYASAVETMSTPLFTSGSVHSSRARGFTGSVRRNALYEESRESAEDRVTNVFLKELESLDIPDQVVWLIDSVNWAGDGLRSWLCRVLDRIAQGHSNRLLMVVAGTDPLHLSPPGLWSLIVRQMEIPPFSEDDLLEPLKLLKLSNQPIGLLAMAGTLIRATKGKPMEVCAELAHWLGY